ncbi:MAG: molybdopterin molybdotransferase MoeA [Coraliomargarita sp.]
MNPLITPHEAEARIADKLPKLPAIECPLNKCAGRVLREVINADRPVPPFNRAMMDGYAIRLADREHCNNFTICGQALAGCPQVALADEMGSCIEIMTGAVVPTGADCVVRYEDTQINSSGKMELIEGLKLEAGEAIHPIGSDQAEGTELISAGRIIGSREIGIAATCGHSTLEVAKLPAITIVSTGDELVDVDTQPRAYQLRRSNDIAIETALARAHLHAEQRVTLPDDKDVSKEQLRKLTKKNNFLIITGGISKGKKDYIPEVLNELGLKNHFHGVSQKPGKPFGYWSDEHCGVFALPGNPLSVLVGLHRYVLPALFKAMGAKASSPSTVELIEDAPAHAKLTYFLPAKLLARGSAVAMPANNSGDLVSILQTDGFIELAPSSSGEAPTGTDAPFIAWH